MSYWQYVPGIDLNRKMYDQIAASAKDTDVIVETQVGFGRGLHYLLDALAARNVNPKVYAFDTFGEKHQSEHWEGYPMYTPWGESFVSWSTRIGGPSRLIDQFAFHLANNPSSRILTDWAQFPSWTVAEEFPEFSVTYLILNGPVNEARRVYDWSKWGRKMKLGGNIWYADLDSPIPIGS